MVALLWALFVGIVIGGGSSALALYGLQAPLQQPLAGWIAYVLAAVAGVLVGLVAGKPIWAKGARIEAGLKAGFGAALGAALMFALRKWVGFHVDLSSVGIGQTVLGTSPVLSLPIVATVMALLFEVDNMFGGEDKKDGQGGSGTGKRIAAGKAGGGDGAAVEEEVEAGSETTRGRAKR